MRKTIVYALALPVIFAACDMKKGKKDMIEGTWQATGLENAQMDSGLAISQKFIDTVGKHSDETTNIKLYGTSNMDSLRKVMQSQLDSMKTLQEEAVKNTVFNFRKDGMAVLTFSGRTDSAKWHYDQEGNSIVLDITQGQDATKLNLDIAKLTNTEMKLKIVENGAASTVSFHRK